jgi:hypothetical protein
MKDQAIRDSSCYNNVMSAMLSKELNNLKLNNPFKKYNLKKIIKKNFWTGNYFLDDLSGNKYIAGDANVFPFWTGIFNDKKMLKSCIKEIRKEGLDKPFPLKYTKKNVSKKNFVSFLVPNYESNTIWMHMGLLYVQLVKKIDKKLFNKYFRTYTKLIKKHKNFLEVFNLNGTPYQSPFYYCDESMLWAANYLALKKGKL